MILDFVDEPMNKDKIFQQMVEYFKTYRKLILYHGTTNLLKDKILEEGLLCRKTTNNSVFEGRTLEGRDLESKEQFSSIGARRVRDRWAHREFMVLANEFLMKNASLPMNDVTAAVVNSIMDMKPNEEFTAHEVNNIVSFYKKTQKAK